MIVKKRESLDTPLISHPSDPKEEKFIWGGHPSPTGNKKLRGIFGGLDFLEIPREKVFVESELLCAGSRLKTRNTVPLVWFFETFQ